MDDRTISGDGLFRSGRRFGLVGGDGNDGRARLFELCPWVRTFGSRLRRVERSEAYCRRS